MIKIFFDTSVVLSASKSKTGGSSYLLMLCRKGEIKGYISKYVVYEAKKISSSLLNEHEKQRLNFLLLAYKLNIVEEPSQVQIDSLSRYIEKKDGPILAAARVHRVDFLVTLNTRDFMKKEVKKVMYPIQILTPKDLIEREKF